MAIRARCRRRRLLRRCCGNEACREPIVIHLDVPDEPLVARLTARRQCPQCMKIYNLQSQPPRVAGVCDDDGAALVTREDDRESVIRDRLHAYHELTGPILDWFGPAGSTRWTAPRRRPRYRARLSAGIGGLDVSAHRWPLRPQPEDAAPALRHWKDLASSARPCAALSDKMTDQPGLR